MMKKIAATPSIIDPFNVYVSIVFNNRQTADK